MSSSATATAWTRWQAPDMQLAHGDFREVVLSSPVGLSDVDVQAAREEARRAGWEQGLAEGRQAARGELRLQAERWQQLVDHLAQPLAALDAEVEQELLGVALAVAQRVIQDELRAEPGHVLATIRQACAALPAASRHIRLHLHPEDAHLVAENLPAHGDSQWHLIEDASISRGGCLLDSGSTHVDARLETRIDDAIATLAGDDVMRAVAK